MTWDKFLAFLPYIISGGALVYTVINSRHQSTNYDSNTIKNLMDSVGQSNNNYVKMAERVTVLEKTVWNYECWNRALCAQLIRKGENPIGLEQAVLEASKSVRTVE